MNNKIKITWFAGYNRSIVKISKLNDNPEPTKSPKSTTRSVNDFLHQAHDLQFGSHSRRWLGFEGDGGQIERRRILGRFRLPRDAWLSGARARWRCWIGGIRLPQDRVSKVKGCVKGTDLHRLLPCWSLLGFFWQNFFFFTCKSGFYLAMDLWVYVHMDFGFVYDGRCIDFLVIVKVCLAIAVGIG